MSDYKVIANASNLHELGVVRSLLESNGIPTIVNHEYVSQTLPMLTPGHAGVELLVNSADYDKALEILNDNNMFDHTELEEVSDKDYIDTIISEHNRKKKYSLGKFFLYLVVICLLILLGLGILGLIIF